MVPRNHSPDMTYARALAILVLALAPGSSLAEPAISEPKTLERLHDPVVVVASALAALPDHATARCRLYAARGGKLEPIPFQFDERGTDGELVLSEAGTDGDFTFDDNDELVFMAKDSGDRLPPSGLPRGGDAALEIEVTDPARGEHGWAYLLHFPADPPPRSPVRYATYDTAREEARALYYQVSYSHDRSNFLGDVRIPPVAGGTGEPLIRRIAMRISPTFSFLSATWGTTFTEESFSVVPDGLKNGPVRAVRRVRQSLDLGKFFPEMPNGKVYTYYYFSSFSTPSTFSIPWLALKTLHDFHFESVDDFGPEGSDMRYWDGANPGGVAFTGGNRPVASDHDHDWWVVSGSRGTCLHALMIPKPWRSWGITRGIVFKDEESPGPGSAGDLGAGYSLLRMTNLREPGAYEISSAMVVLPRAYRPGDETDALAMLRAPLETSTRPLAIEIDDGREERRAERAPTDPSAPAPKPATD
jgi:hypothetical protein